MSEVSKTSSTAGHATASSKMHEACADNVHVQSVVQTETQSKVSMDNSRKMAELMSRLGSTHSQIDEYSRRRTEEISEAVAESIKKIVLETQQLQQQLVADANARSAEIEHKFKLQLQEYVAKIDADKAGFLAQLEKDLNTRQEAILESARHRIDSLNEEANRLKMGVLKEAQAQSAMKTTEITDHVVALGQQEAHRRLESTTTTVITTKAASAGETHAAGAMVNMGSTVTSSEKHASSSSSSSSAMETGGAHMTKH